MPKINHSDKTVFETKNLRNFWHENSNIPKITIFDVKIQMEKIFEFSRQKWSKQLKTFGRQNSNICAN